MVVRAVSDGGNVSPAGAGALASAVTGFKANTLMQMLPALI